MSRSVDYVWKDEAIQTAPLTLPSGRRIYEPRPLGRGGLLAILFAPVLVLPFLYAGVFYDTWSFFDLKLDYRIHISLNVLCNFAVLAIAWSSTGRLQKRFTNVALGVVVSHLVLIMIVVAGRLYYSRPLLFGAIFVSLALGFGMVRLMDQVRARRVAAIVPGLSTELEAWLGPNTVIARDPATDLRAYDLILVNFDDELPKEWRAALTRAVLAGSEVSHVAEYLERARGRVSPDHFSLDHLSMSRNGRYPAVKRAIDVATVILVAPSFVILIGVAAAAIALTMGRPIFFTQNRVGRGGKVFSMYKLRTMRPRVEGEPVRATAENDPRITPLGRMLRQYHVDELPQIWNVLKGEMSLIGPRPEQPELVRIYSEQMPAYAFRHTVRPGITGWSQVCFGYAENFQETREKLTYDLHYVKFLSLALDVKVAMMTIRTLVSGPPVR